jgi:hypothetical protein
MLLSYIEIKKIKFQNLRRACLPLQSSQNNTFAHKKQTTLSSATDHRLLVSPYPCVCPWSCAKAKIFLWPALQRKRWKRQPLQATACTFEAYPSTS